MLTEEASAKVNLSLHVGALRPDGYHDLDTVIVPLELHDTLIFAEAEDYELSGMTLPIEENTITKAYRLLKSRFPRLPGAKIEVKKRIPIGAGLGGESADGAAALRGISRLFNLNLTQDDLLSLSRAIGSDTAALLEKRACRLKRRDDIVSFPIVRMKPRLLLLIPKERGQKSYSTKEIYMHYRPRNTKSVAPKVIRALEAGDEEGLYRIVQNDLEKGHPSEATIKRLRRELKPQGAEAVILAGSGAGIAVFGCDLSRVKEALSKSETFSIIETAFKG